FLIAISGAYDYVSNWMAAVGILIPPLGGVILGDYYLVRKRKLPPLKEAQLVNYRPAALAAYVIGVLAAFLSERSSFLIPPLNGILVGGLALYLLQRLCSPKPTSNSL
ncbi:MAG: hypothetical protein P9M08_01680, partial [Candidatus Erginobacter occultus]|nr:hypothetical protein [Candidatus Erginobacter occultus]